MARFTDLVVALCVLGVAAGCGNDRQDRGGPKVAVSIFPLYDLTRRIAGDRIEVVLVLPPGRSEHGYDPTPKEIARLDGAKLGITVGLDLDPWAETIMKGVGDPRILRLGEKMDPRPIDTATIGGAHDDTRGVLDPHVWMDPDRMVGAVDVIAEALGTLDPASEVTFAGNAAALKRSLVALDANIRVRSRRWSKHPIVTFHGSMSYYARRYGIRIAAVVEPIAGKEPTASYVAQVIATIRTEHVAALFTEPQLDKAPAEAIANEAGIPMGELDPVGGVPGRDSYEALLAWDTEQLAKVLE